jgi:cell division protein ZapD
MKVRTFEYPLNEKIRNYLRVEALYQLLIEASPVDTLSRHQSFFRALFDLNDVFDRSDWHADLLKDLDKQQTILKRWATFPGVDALKIATLLETLTELQHAISRQTKSSPLFKEDRLLSAVRQRFNLPGGTCAFDLPQLYHWCHQPLNNRQADIARWLEPYNRPATAIALLLKLMREQSQGEWLNTTNGFYQDFSKGCELLRIEIDEEAEHFPVMSGHKNRFAFRFFNQQGAVNSPLEFKLTCCKSYT